MILVGELALWVALLMAAWGAIVALAGGRAGRADLIESAVRSVYAAFACVVLAISGLLVALVSSDFTFRFVASFTSANLPLGYKVAALWSGPAGALLFCTVVLSTCAAIAVGASSEGDAKWIAPVAGIFSAIMLSFVATLCFAVNPYERMVSVPVEGQGMFPLLHHPGFVMHAPLRYLASIATSVPFALAGAALARARIDDQWSLAVRRWASVSWFLLTLGMITGMWWAYTEVGDAGHWALDPVRNLSILPWVTSSALMYSVSRQMPRASVVLALASFLLAALGTFIVRGGILSMNPVASWSGVAEWLTAILVVATLTAAYLLITRWPLLAATTTVNRGVEHTRVRYAGYAVLVGLVLVATALAGGLFSTAADVTLGSGETATITDPFGDRREFTSQGVSRFDVLNRHVVAVALQAAHDGETTALIISEERQYVDSRGAHTFNPSMEAGIDHSLRQDVYVVLTRVMGDRAQVRIAFHPLVMWVWIGGTMVAVGGAVAMWGGS